MPVDSKILHYYLRVSFSDGINRQAINGTQFLLRIADGPLVADYHNLLSDSIYL